MYGGLPSALTANAFDATSLATTASRMGQKTTAFELLLRIFLALLALDAVPRVRQRVQALECDVLAAVVTFPEGLGRFVQPAQRLIDVPEEPSFLAREQERLFALHGVGALIRHMERIGAQ